jgi:rRNA processing protein Gar1
MYIDFIFQDKPGLQVYIKKKKKEKKNRKKEERKEGQKNIETKNSPSTYT